MSEDNPPKEEPLAPKPEQERSSNPVFSQQLFEVHLLLDFLSSLPANTLSDVKRATDAGLDPDWIELICRITWPPENSAVDRAREEALLIKVKDYLNAMAAPATGASVAFTLLVAQEDQTARPNRRPRATPVAVSDQVGQSYSRDTLARGAFPGFIDKAHRFGGGMKFIAIGLTIWLVVTCGLSWYAALGNAQLAQLTTAQAAFAAAEEKVVAEQSGQGGAEKTIAAKLSSSRDYCAQFEKAAPQPADAAASGAVAFAPLPQVCANWNQRYRELRSAEANIRQWLPFNSGKDTGPSIENPSPIYYATAAVGVLGTGILPVCYGILGAAAAVLRLLSRRIRLSLLTPRDWTLSLQQLALGAVIGACIGLFVTPPGTEPHGASELFGPVALSTSALSFIAGFGVEAVFGALESLIGRLFNTAPPAK